ncbi:MAG TPA: response regulator, partial [Bacteroidota bacterium]|nr:response regulator [Bacteroidota bacterium]
MKEGTHTPRAKKILLVEDEDGLAELLANLLISDGYDVIIAHNGREGLEKLEGMKPDAIISDIVMPEMDGLEMFRQIKANAKTSSVPF